MPLPKGTKAESGVELPPTTSLTLDWHRVQLRRKVAFGRQRSLSSQFVLRNSWPAISYHLYTIPAGSFMVEFRLYEMACQKSKTTTQSTLVQQRIAS